MSRHQPPIRSLILLGGNSSRMGSPKYLLPIPSSVSETGCETPLLIHHIYLHHIFQVKYGDPLIRTVTMSVRDEVQRNDVKELLSQHESDLPTDLNINYVQDSHDNSGPVAGLIAAWRLDSNVHWLVTGCELPLLSKRALEELRSQHHRGRKAVTCFETPQGRNEPFLSLWTGTALEEVSRLMDDGGTVEVSDFLKLLEQQDGTGPTDRDNYTWGITTAKPREDKWITTVNTKDEWEKVEKHLNDEFGHSDP